ncbi:MAG: PocR ligand-binding domain-containing protein [Actinobacteria bacterium]|nr:PocR ligand-binding domain-containing protein [Actinomycetota bacterium]
MLPGHTAPAAPPAAPLAEEVPAEGSDWKLTDLISVSTLQSIQDTFARAFGLPTVIVDPSGANATRITHRLGFCEDLTRTSPVGGPRCLDCDLRAMHQAREDGRPTIFECWNGLYDAAIPIAPKGKVLGYFLCGQVLTDAPDRERYKQTAGELGVEPDRYVAALDDVRILPYEQYRASVESMHVLADMIAEQAAAAIDNLMILEEALNAKEEASGLMEELDNILGTLSDIGSQPDYRSTLEAIADNLARLIPYDSCLIYILDDATDTLVPAIVRDPYPDALRAFRPTVGEGIVGKVAATRTERLIEDASVDPDFIEIPGAPAEPEALLAVPMVHKQKLLGVISLSRFERQCFTEHEFRILSALASTQAALAVENVRMYERERQLLDRYRLLADLGTEFVAADSLDEVKEQLLSRTAEIFSADRCFVAIPAELQDDVRVQMREGRGRSWVADVPLSRAARLSWIRLHNERTAGRGLFDAWAREIVDQLSERADVASFIAEPLTTASGIIGAVFVGWHRPVDPQAGDRRMLKVIAGAAGATLSNFAVHAQTDSSLRLKVEQLQTLTRLAERLSGSTEERSIVAELLQAAIEIGNLEGAAYLARGSQRWILRQSSGAAQSDHLPAILDGLESRGRLSGVTWTADRDEQLVVVALPVGERVAALVGRAAAGHDAHAGDAEVEPLLTALARYASVAIERAQLYEAQQSAIARLERSNLAADQTNRQLNHLLELQRELTVEVLESSGLEPVARSLAEMTQAEVVVVDAWAEVLARWPEDSTLSWEPPERRDVFATATETEGEHTIVACPAVVEGEALAWVVACAHGELTQVGRAALEHGALLTALELLRERTALEVEVRLRGGLVEELFSGQFVEEMVLKQGLGLGFDLTAPSRVILVEPASGDATRGDIETIYAMVSARTERWSAQTLSTVRGNLVVVLCHETPDEPDARLEDELLEALCRRLPKPAVNVACGTRAASLAGYRESYIAARRGLDLLRMMERVGSVFSFRDAGVEHLLMRTTEPEIVLEFMSTYVEPLERYDANHSSDLRHSLETYYATGLNVEGTARRLHIHVSTLRYRLKKIEQLLGVDVKGAGRLDVELALRAATVLHPLRK